MLLVATTQQQITLQENARHGGQNGRQKVIRKCSSEIFLRLKEIFKTILIIF